MAQVAELIEEGVKVLKRLTAACLIAVCFHFCALRAYAASYVAYLDDPALAKTSARDIAGCASLRRDHYPHLTLSVEGFFNLSDLAPDRLFLAA